MSEAVKTLDLVRHSGVVGIVRATTARQALEQAERVLDAGLEVMEVSLTTPDALDVIARLARTYDAVVGAGTVLDAGTADRAINAGARILVCPTMRPEVIARAVKRDVAVLPGCLTPTEMAIAMDAGATAVKIFPAHLWSPSALAGLLQAMPDLPCVPTGGVSPDDAAAWISAGALAVGVGSALTAVKDPATVVAALTDAITLARTG